METISTRKSGSSGGTTSVRSYVSGRFSPRPQSIDAVRKFTWEGSLDYTVAAEAGHVETRLQKARFETEFERGDRFNVELTESYEFLARPFDITDEVTIPVGGYTFRDVQLSYELGLQHWLAGTFSVQHGGFFRGDISAVGFNRGRIEITQQLSLEPSFSFNWVDLPEGMFTTNLVVTRVNYTFTPRMFLSGLLQFSSSSDTISTNMRLRWEYQPGSELIVVYSEDRETEVLGFSRLRNRGFVVKFNRLFRY